MLLLVVLCLTATLPGPTMGQAEGSSVTARPNANKILGDIQISSLQRRKDLLDTRLTNLHTQLNTQKTEVNARLDKIESRFDGMETRLSDMEEYLKIQLEAMGKKVELALGHANTKQQNNLEKSTVDSPDFRPPRVPQVHQGCQDALVKGWKTSGIYTISPEQNMTMDVYCDQQKDGGGWTVFQARKDGSVDFYRTWNAYKSGFGDLRGEFWLGNTNIYLLTKHHDQELKVELTSHEGEVEYADYNSFWIEDEAQKYKLHVTGYTGGRPPGDSLDYSNGAFFSTRDRDFDTAPGSCATSRTGAWWYKQCSRANLNGNYTGSSFRGITWYDWKGLHVSMRSTRMMIRKRS